jgi:hypothetical protein
MAIGVAQGVGPEFKPQYWENNNQKTPTNQTLLSTSSKDSLHFGT